MTTSSDDSEGDSGGVRVIQASPLISVPSSGKAAMDEEVFRGLKGSLGNMSKAAAAAGIPLEQLRETLLGMANTVRAGRAAWSEAMTAELEEKLRDELELEPDVDLEAELGEGE